MARPRKRVLTPPVKKEVPEEVVGTTADIIIPDDVVVELPPDSRETLIRDLSILFKEDLLGSYDTELLRALRLQHIGY